MPYVFDDAGLEVKTLAEIRDEMLKDVVDEFDGDFDVSADSPVYKIYTPVAMQLAEAWQGLREVHANRDPESAAGSSLAGLGSFAGMKYRGATASTIRGRVVGDPGAQVPSTLVLRYKAGKSLWQLSSAPVIGAGGVVEVDAFSLDTGPVDADAVGLGGWEIVVGATGGITGYESLAKAQLGEAAETYADFRLRLLRAARGLATYDAIVREVSEVANVTSLLYYQNEKLTPDLATGLLGKQGHMIVRGGAKLDILRALHRAVGAPLETVGSVTDTITASNGQTLKYGFSRLKRRRGYLRITLNGGNAKIKLPENADALARAAINAINLSIEGSTFVPYVFGQAVANAMPIGSVGSMVAEGRLDPGDPYTQAPIQLPIDEQIEVATGPQPVEIFGSNEDPIFYEAGVNLDFAINGDPMQSPIATMFHDSTLSAASDLGTQSTDVELGSIDGRFFMRTLYTGLGASIEIFPSFGQAALGLDVGLYEGTSGDLELVINP